MVWGRGSGWIYEKEEEWIGKETERAEEEDEYWSWSMYTQTHVLQIHEYILYVN
jgi:hypothetical protein